MVNVYGITKSKIKNTPPTNNKNCGTFESKMNFLFCLL